jgi:RNA polymerase sigma-70 factor (ECF subfamily)
MASPESKRSTVDALTDDAMGRRPPERTAAEVAAFEAMFRAHYVYVCAYARRFVRSQAVAEELAQDVFARIWARPGSMETGRNERAYLFVAMKRTALNYLAREGLAARYEAAQEHEASLERDRWSSTDVAEDRELEARVQAAVEALPPQARAVWRLQREAGMSYAEVARELNLSVKTVERHMGRALRGLRVSLAGYLAMVVAVVLTR